MTLMLMSMALWAEQTVTVSANSSDISEGLDLKVVAKLFAEAKNLEEFETMLNNPDSAFCNLDLNGDGQVDYLRVVETGEGDKRLIVLQAILAKDIYQDVASIYVEKDEKDQVSVQVVGDEYVYGKAYIIEPVYVYRPAIYDWFWSTSWVAWYSPWYWGYYPGWWYVHSCWAHDWYWHHCYAWHHRHYYCSFRPGREMHHGYHDLHQGVSRRDYAVAHPERAFVQRNSGLTNAREIRSTTAVQRGNTARGADMRSTHSDATVRSTEATRSDNSRTFGSRNTAVTREAATREAATRTTATREAATRNTDVRTTTATTRSTTATRNTDIRTTTATRGTTATRNTDVRTTTAARNTDMRTTPTRSTASFNTSRSSGSFSGGGRTATRR